MELFIVGLGTLLLDILTDHLFADIALRPKLTAPQRSFNRRYALEYFPIRQTFDPLDQALGAVACPLKAGQVLAVITLTT